MPTATVTVTAKSEAQLHGAWLVLTGIVAAQSGATVASGLFDEVAPSTVVFFRQLITGLVLVAIARPAIRSMRRDQLASTVLFGVVMATMSLSFYAAVSRLPLALAVTIELSGPLGLSLLLSRRRVDALLAVIAAAGVLIIRSQSLSTSGASRSGVMFALGAGACWAAYILLNRRLGQRFDGADGLGLGMLAASAFSFPFALHSGLGAAIHGDRPIRVALVAVLSGLITFSCELEALRRLPARSVAVLLNLSPAVAALLGLVWLDQRLSLLELAGMSLIVTASVATVRNRQHLPPLSRSAITLVAE